VVARVEADLVERFEYLLVDGGAGFEPAERASCRPTAARRNSRSAITERPWLPTQMNSTLLTRPPL
jgi:hypothetical protein